MGTLPNSTEALPNDANLRRKAVRGGTILLTSRLCIQLFTWGIGLVVIRLLTPYDYGVMASAGVVVGLADLLTNAGIGRALVRQEHIEPRDLAEGFTLSLILATILYGITFLAADPVAEALGTPELSAVVRIAGLTLFLTPFRAIPQAILDRSLRMGRSSAIAVATSILGACLLLGLAFAGMGYWSLVASALAGSVIEAVGLRYATGWHPQLAKPGKRARTLLGYGGYISLTALLWYAYGNSDRMIIGAIAGPIALGYFSVAWQLVTLTANRMTAQVNQVAFSTFCRLQHDLPRLQRYYLRMTALLSLIGMPVMVGLALVAEDAFLILFGERWLPAVQPFQLLSLVGMLMVPASTLSPLVNALGRPDLNFRLQVVNAVIFPIGFAIGAWAYGLIGVCIAWLVVYPSAVCLSIWVTRSLIGIGFTQLALAQAPIIAGVALMTGAVLATRPILGGMEGAATRLIATAGIGAAVYVASILLIARKTLVADVRTLLRELRASPK